MAERGTAVAPVERLEGRLRGLRGEGRAALVAYGVAGYPDLPGSLVVLNLSGRGDKDVETVAGLLDAAEGSGEPQRGAPVDDG